MTQKKSHVRGSKAKDTASRPETSLSTGGLTANDRAALAELEATIGSSGPPIATELVRALRETGASSDEVAGSLRAQAYNLNFVAKRLAPEPKTRDAMLHDALEIISAAEEIFYVEGEDTTSPDGLMREALRVAEQEFDLFSAMKESRGSDLHWQELWRASYRAKLAWKLAEFRRKHPEWRPMTAENDEQTERAAGGAS